MKEPLAQWTIAFVPSFVHGTNIALICQLWRQTLPISLAAFYSIASDFTLFHHGNGIHLNAREYVYMHIFWLFVIIVWFRFLHLCNRFFHKTKTNYQGKFHGAVGWSPLNFSPSIVLHPALLLLLSCVGLLLQYLSACLCMHIRMRFLHAMHTYAYIHDIEYIQGVIMLYSLSLCLGIFVCNFPNYIRTHTSMTQMKLAMIWFCLCFLFSFRLSISASIHNPFFSHIISMHQFTFSCFSDFLCAPLRLFYIHSLFLSHLFMFIYIWFYAFACKYFHLILCANVMPSEREWVGGWMKVFEKNKTKRKACCHIYIHTPNRGPICMDWWIKRLFTTWLYQKNHSYLFT